MSYSLSGPCSGAVGAGAIFPELLGLFLRGRFAMFLLIGVTAQGAEGEAASHAELIKESLAALKENTAALKSLTEALKRVQFNGPAVGASVFDEISDKTLYASFISLNLSSAFLFPIFTSG